MQRKLSLSALAAAAIAAAVIGYLDLRLVSWKAGVRETGGQLDSASEPLGAMDRPREAAHGAAETRLKSEAPWAQWQKKFDEGDFQWLVANARAAPEQGSYSFANQALRECMELAYFGSEEEQTAKLKATYDGQSAIRIAALQRLFAPCRALGSSFNELRATRQALMKEMVMSGDSRHRALELAYTEATSPAISPTARREVIATALDLRDGDVAAALKGAIVDNALGLDGQKLSERDRASLGAAWDMAICDLFGRCLGPESRTTLAECARNARCDFQTTASRVQSYAPFSLAATTSRYHTIIVQSIRNRRYDVLGP